MSSVDSIELSKFEKNAAQWWDENGEFKILHKINPVRISYLCEKIRHHFELETPEEELLTGLDILDVGCGGGLVSMPLSKLGANLTGLDANNSNVNAASQHAKDNNINANFINITVEEHIKSGKQYDVIVALEIIEHVNNPEQFVKDLTNMVKPGGMLVISTINRTIKSYVHAIVMAEYVLGFVPRNTHQHGKFIKPSELNKMLSGTKLSLKELKGMTLELPSMRWQLNMDVDVNYFAYIG